MRFGPYYIIVTNIYKKLIVSRHHRNHYLQYESFKYKIIIIEYIITMDNDQTGNSETTEAQSK